VPTAHCDGNRFIACADDKLIALTYFQTRLQAMSEFNLPIVHQIQDAFVDVRP